MAGCATKHAGTHAACQRRRDPTHEEPHEEPRRTLRLSSGTVDPERQVFAMLVFISVSENATTTTTDRRQKRQAGHSEPIFERGLRTRTLCAWCCPAPRVTSRTLTIFSRECLRALYQVCFQAVSQCSRKCFRPCIKLLESFQIVFQSSVSSQESFQRVVGHCF